MNILTGLEPIEPENYEGITFSFPTPSTKENLMETQCPVEEGKNSE